MLWIVMLWILLARGECLTPVVIEGRTGRRFRSPSRRDENQVTRLEQEGDPTVCDLAIGSAASRVEHYEMAGYQSAIALAESLHHDEAVKLLTESLLEEQAAGTTVKELCGRLKSSVEEAQPATVMCN